LPWRHVEAWEIHLERRQIMRIVEPTAALGDRALRVVSQPQLLELMVGEARTRPSFAFLPGASVRDVLRDGDRVRGVRIADTTGERDLEADLTIGCDGRASTVRRRAELEL
jgi:2-polyprenyl-6-methoxyphenol hydroxylase-like FAD-dependent oxidoreductase